LLNLPLLLDCTGSLGHDDLMETNWASGLRCRLFLPDKSEVTFAKRGWKPAEPARQANLEKVGLKFLEGYEYGLQGRTLADVESALETIEPAFRGFAYEGCGMAMAIRDALPMSGRHWTRDLLASRGANHVYMVYIGVGWAMARLPKIRWSSIHPHDPVLSWLALDGLGFHQAYFHTKKYIDGQQQDRIPGWEPQAYAQRVFDQGVGRALWFINGSDVQRAASCIGAFAPSRQADLWSGTGLASVYAGGVDAGELSDMVRLSGQYRSNVAQGAAFAAKARLLAGLVTPGTELGVKVHCDMSVEEAAAVTEEAQVGLPASDTDVPIFEVWRERIRQNFV
jgi:enediyne biosynthesis protein E3